MATYSDIAIAAIIRQDCFYSHSEKREHGLFHVMLIDPIGKTTRIKTRRAFKTLKAAKRESEKLNAAIGYRA